MIITVSSHEFSQDASGARAAALKGPVFITDRGRPTHVLLNIEEYRRLAGGASGAGGGIADMLAMPVVDAAAEIDFDPPRLNLPLRPWSAV